MNPNDLTVFGFRLSVEEGHAHGLLGQHHRAQNSKGSVDKPRYPGCGSACFPIERAPLHVAAAPCKIALNHWGLCGLEILRLKF